MEKIRVMIVDDHALFREGIRSLLNNYEDIEIIGEAIDGRQALEKAAELEPEVILMDIGMPGMGGVEATRRIHKDYPRIAVLALTQHQDSEYILSMLKSGAKGYVAKTATAEELVTAVRAVSHGESYLNPTATKTLINEVRAQSHGEPSEYERLTGREREVLQLVAEGRSNQDIAGMLCISIKTVLKHRASIMEKLGFHNRTELIKFAISKGLIEMPHDPRSNP